jgi:hypothetical protein
MVVDYSQSKIYYIICNTTGLKYIGSTTKKYLSQRLQGHIGFHKSYLKGKSKYITSIRVLENKNFEIVLIENFPCMTKDELRARERFHIQSNVCVNKNIPTRTWEDYKIDNIANIKKYYIKNKCKLSQKAKDVYLVKKDDIDRQHRMYYKENREKISLKHKEYTKINSEKLSKLHQKYYQENKEIMAQKMAIKFTCECGSCITMGYKSHHKNSKKHIAFLNSLTQPSI